MISQFDSNLRMCKKVKYLNEIIFHMKKWRLVQNTEASFQYYKAWELKSEREKPCVINAVELPLEEVGANFITRF